MDEYRVCTRPGSACGGIFMSAAYRNHYPYCIRDLATGQTRYAAILKKRLNCGPAKNKKARDYTFPAR